MFDFSEGAPTDNAHETMTVTWYAPMGLETVQALLRVAYDGFIAPELVIDDEYAVLVDAGGSDEPLFAPGVEVLELTATTLTVTFNIHDVLTYVCEGEEEEPVPFCEDGVKIQSLSFTYVGEDCDASDHHQDPSKVFCAGDPAMAAPVRIIAADKDDPFHRRAHVYFDGTLGLGDTFTADALAAGMDRFKGDLRLFVLDENDAVLQANKMHVSCSEPLFVGDQFGAFVLDGFTLR